jgi:N6-adenosine-specific RNA methylase IME4
MARDLVRVAKDITIGELFRCTGTGLKVTGRPTLEQWRACGAQLARIEGAVQWWIGDWVNYGRKAYGEKYTEAIETIDLDQHTLENYAYTAQNIQSSRRREMLPFSVHAEVVGLPSAREQDQWLERAATGDGDGVPWTRAQLRRALQLERLTTRLPTALPGTYDVIAADPPWSYSNSGFDQSAAAHYPTLDVDAIAALPTTDPTFPKTADDAVLFLWCTSPLLPDGVRVLEAWGYAYRASIIWDKGTSPGLGWWVHTRHELLLIGERGRLHPLERPDSVVALPVAEHSEKPDAFYTLIARMYPQFRRVELFARKTRPDWDAWGNEVDGAGTH